MQGAKTQRRVEEEAVFMNSRAEGQVGQWRCWTASGHSTSDEGLSTHSPKNCKELINLHNWSGQVSRAFTGPGFTVLWSEQVVRQAGSSQAQGVLCCGLFVLRFLFVYAPADLGQEISHLGVPEHRMG